MITDQPIVDVPKKDRERIDRDTERMLLAAGHVAFAAGLPISRCPDFKDPDMACWWRMGWYRERDGQKSIPPAGGL